MGKKGKKKKNRRKLYNKKEFVNIFCNDCGICEGSPIFCYDDIYRSHPQLFLKISKNLQEVKDWNELRRMEGTSMLFDPGQFRFAFCKALETISGCGLVVINCEHFGICYGLFKSQVFGRKHDRLQKKRRTKRQKKKYIAKPYPTLIVNKDEKWEKFIKDTLSDGNIDREQNTAEAGAICTKGEVDQ